jgi:hypothetical protein
VIVEGDEMVKSPEEGTRRYALRSLMAFLDGEKNLNWIVGVIRESGIRGQRLAEVFERLEEYGDAERYQEALSACREQGWIE